MPGSTQRLLGVGSAVSIVSVIVAVAAGGRQQASVVAPEQLFLTPWRPPDGQRCEVVTGAVPAFDAIFDSSAVAALLQARRLSGHVLFDVDIHPPQDTVRQRLGAGRLNVDLRVIESQGPAGLAQTVAGALHVLVRQPIDSRFILRLDLPGGTVRRAPALLCRAALAGEHEFYALLAALRPAGLRAEPDIEVEVGADGSVRTVTLSRSSGNDDFDRDLLSAARAAQFNPALVNRSPVTMRQLFRLRF